MSKDTKQLQYERELLETQAEDAPKHERDVIKEKLGEINEALEENTPNQKPSQEKGRRNSP